MQTETCINIASFGHYGQNKPFIDLQKAGTNYWKLFGVIDNTYADPVTGYLSGVPVGTLGLSSIIQVSGYPYAALRAGNYRLRWKGSLAMSVGGDVVDGKHVSNNLYEFTVLPKFEIKGIAFADPSLTLEANMPPDATTPGDYTFGVVYHVDDEPAFFAGYRYQRDWKSALCGANHIRTMDLNNAAMGPQDNYGKESLTSIEVDNYYRATARAYGQRNENDVFFPPAEIGFLLCETGAGLFDSIPVQTSRAAMDYRARTIVAYAGAGWRGVVRPEMGDETWNRAFPWVKNADWLEKHIAPTIRVVNHLGEPSEYAVDMVGCATAHRALEWWAAWERVLPRERVRRVLAGQFWGGDGGGQGGMLMYVDEATGYRVGDLIDEYAVAPYWSCDAGDNMTVEEMLAGRYWEKGDDWWINRAKVNIDLARPYLKRNQDLLATMAPRAKLTMYEGGGRPVELPSPTDANREAVVAMEKYLLSFMEGAGGEAIMRYYYESFARDNFTLYNQYNSHGGSLGLAFQPYSIDTPRMKYFRSISA